jgi:HlyD family secretion protein
MRRLGWFLAALFAIASIAGTAAFLVYKAMEPPEVFDTGQPKVADIVKKTVATGAIVPRNEIEIKSRVSGILDHLAVEPGDSAQRGDLIARIKVVPDPTNLQRTSTAARRARLNLDEVVRLLDEETRLYESKALPLSELQRRRAEVAQRREELAAAQAEMTLVREGALRNAEAIATDIRSTVEGMVLAVDVKIGSTITETNTFNPGTTIAVVADMSDMVFEGRVDESEVGRIRVGMPLQIVVGALDNRRINGELEYISPRNSRSGRQSSPRRACSSGPAARPTPTSCWIAAIRSWRSTRPGSSSRRGSPTPRSRSRLRSSSAATSSSACPTGWWSRSSRG